MCDHVTYAAWLQPMKKLHEKISIRLIHEYRSGELDVVSHSYIPIFCENLHYVASKNLPTFEVETELF